MNEEATKYTPLTQESITSVISHSKYKNDLQQYMSNHFIGLNEPASISLGFTNKSKLLNAAPKNKMTSYDISVIKDILKSQGIDIVEATEEAAASLDKFIIDESGIRTPFLSPQDALKATTDIYDILRTSGINVIGFALPNTKGTLCKTTNNKTGNVLDLENNIKNNANAQKILQNKNLSVKDYISKQLKKCKNLETVTPRKQTREKAGSSIYRGGTLGNKPYAVTASVRAKDVAYATPYMELAWGYSKGYGVQYPPVMLNGKSTSYGFIYEYQASDDQKYFCDFGIESGGKSNLGDKNDYETPIFEHKNPLKNVYIVVGDTTYKITNDNGKFINKDWEDFVTLHEPYVSQENEFEKQRIDKQLAKADNNEVHSYQKQENNNAIDLRNLNKCQFNDIDISDKNIILPHDVSLNGNIVFGKNNDLSNIKNWEVNKSSIDFSQIQHLELFNADFSKAESIKFSPNTKLNSVKFTDNIDFSSATNLSLQHIDLTNLKHPKFPEHLNIGPGVKFGENIDFSEVKNLELNFADLSQTKSVKFPQNVTFGYGTKLGENTDLSTVENLELRGVDLSKTRNITFPKNVKICENIIFGNNLDFSTAEHLELKDISLPQDANIKFPKKLTLTNSLLTDTGDFSNLEKLEVNNTILKDVDLSKVKDLQLSGDIHLSGDVKLPENLNIDNLKSIKDDRKQYSSFKSYKKCMETEKLLSSWGIDKNDYMIFTKDDDVHTTYLDGSRNIAAYFEEGAKEIANTNSKIVYGSNNGVVAAYLDNGTYIISKNDKLKDKLYYKGKDVGLGVMLSNGEQICDKNRNPDYLKNEQWKEINNRNMVVMPDNNISKTKHEEHSVSVNDNSSNLKKTLKQQADKNVEVLKETLQTQGKSNGSLGSQVAAVSNGIDNAFEKAGNALNDNALGRALDKADSWRPHNKTAAKVMDKVGAVPVAAVVASGVSAYEQYKSGDKKGAAAIFGKGVVHATVQGVATSAGMNIAAKGASKAAAKVTEKVVARQAAKDASKQVAKAAGKAAGKAVGKSVLKKIPLVSLGAGAYFAFERAKNGEWGKAGCELLSGALGCFPGVGTVASTAVDCGLAVADTKQAINETKKKQAAEQAKKEQTPKPHQNHVSARRVAELRGIKTAQSQKKPAQAKKQQQKPVEKSTWDKFTDWFSR